MTTRKKRGFTLIELVITVAIMILLSAFAMPLFASITAQRRLTGSLVRIAGDIRFVQARAVTRGELHRLHSGADGAVSLPGQYRLERSADNGATWQPVEGSVWYNPASEYSGSTLQSVTDNAGTAIATFDVRFDPRGAVANGMVSYPIRLNVVAPNGATGRVEVLRSGVVRIPNT
jgi:type IV fimbrial biogenesis protein FimT